MTPLGFKIVLVIFFDFIMIAVVVYAIIDYIITKNKYNLYEVEP